LVGAVAVAEGITISNRNSIGNEWRQYDIMSVFFIPHHGNGTNAQ
jgi:hypothetical protein